MALVCRILHLSDIHYGTLPGRNSYFHHRFKDKEFVIKCSEAVKKFDKTPKGSRKPLYIVITGDFVCEGSKREQHELAYENLSEFREMLKDYEIDIFLVPGNHDINRDADGASPLKDYVDEVHNKILSSFPDRKLPNDFGSDSEFDKKGTEWIHVIDLKNEKPKAKDKKPKTIAFIPLYSPITKPDLLKNPYTGRLTEPEKRKWLFDRGFITEKQWHSIIKELDNKNVQNEYCLKIAICHHNPLPICRFYKNREIGKFSNPEVNLLANGPELITLLAEKGVSLLLHGHRHQDAIVASFPRQQLVIVGAPSAGLSDEGLIARMKISGNSELGIPPKWQGFNLIDVYQTDLGFSIEVHTFEYIDATYQIGPNETKKIPLYTEPNFPFKALSDSEGVESAVEHLVKSKGGTTSLHYTFDANWDDSSNSAVEMRDNYNIELNASYTPMNRLFEKIMADEEIAKGFVEYLLDIGDVDDDELEKYTKSVSRSKEKGLIDQELRNAMRDTTSEIPWDSLLSSTNDKMPDNFFYKYLGELASQKDRWVLYTLEIMKLLADPKYNLNRCVYFHSNQSNSKVHSRTCNKIVWLLHSLLAYRGLDNVNIAWLPLSIKGAYGQTVLCMEPNNVKPKSKNPSVLVGFRADFDERREDRTSVFRITAMCDDNAPGSVLGNNLRGMITHIVHPLARRMIETFPLMREGRICCSNVKKLINIYQVSDLIESAINTFDSEMAKYSEFKFEVREEEKKGIFSHVRDEKGQATDTPLLWSNRLKELYEWKFWGHKTDQWRPPWNDDDYNWLIQRLTDTDQ